jgi:hypothetical protein
MWEETMKDFELRLIKRNHSIKNSTILSDVNEAISTLLGDKYDCQIDTHCTRLEIDINVDVPEETTEVVVDEVTVDGDDDAS